MSIFGEDPATIAFCNRVEDEFRAEMRSDLERLGRDGFYAHNRRIGLPDPIVDTLYGVATGDVPPSYAPRPNPRGR